MIGLLMLVLFILLVYGFIKIGIEAIYLLAFLGFLYAIKDVVIGFFMGLLPIISIVVVIFVLLTIWAVIEDRKSLKATSTSKENAVVKIEELEETVDADSFGRFE